MDMDSDVTFCEDTPGPSKLIDLTAASPIIFKTIKPKSFNENKITRSKTIQKHISKEKQLKASIKKLSNIKSQVSEENSCSPFDSLFLTNELRLVPESQFTPKLSAGSGSSSKTKKVTFFEDSQDFANKLDKIKTQTIKVLQKNMRRVNTFGKLSFSRSDIESLTKSFKSESLFSQQNEETIVKPELTIETQEDTSKAKTESPDLISTLSQDWELPILESKATEVQREIGDCDLMPTFSQNWDLSILEAKAQSKVSDEAMSLEKTESPDLMPLLSQNLEVPIVESMVIGSESTQESNEVEDFIKNFKFSESSEELQAKIDDCTKGLEQLLSAGLGWCYENKEDLSKLMKEQQEMNKVVTKDLLDEVESEINRLEREFKENEPTALDFFVNNSSGI